MTVPTTVDVLIVGGGPAGALLGCLLARRGIEVLHVEKQSSLERDFRGETLAAPSAVTLRRLGFDAALKAHGYLETSSVTMRMEGRQVFTIDYAKFPIGALPIDIPQPALIGIFQQAARAEPTYHYAASTNCTGLIEQGGQILGAVLKCSDGSRVEVRSRLVVGADGRFSKVRKAAGLEATITPMGRDFLSFKLPRPADWGNQAQLVVNQDKHLVVLPTFPDFLRIGHNLPKRGLGEVRKEGFDAFRNGIAAIDPRLRPLLHEFLTSFDDTSFLEIFTAELDQWARDGLVLIGDASHTVTPILGQGVNLAIQDVVCVAPVIAGALKKSHQQLQAAEFDAFVTDRKAHKAQVTRYQRIQEAALGAQTPFAVLARRARYSALNALPIKYRVFGKVINAPHPIDPVDLRTGASESAVRAAA
ncbi:2-polyprenyl-6-methoxyphenol hydroxylase-like FAD-dependent oxidoreductase [Kitasatospora sp. GAS204A]|uniref:FAD-dependent monooxygenase n=1 Tax=unclassified Kitasatospora TaxID=2633591 RepID=UPI0024733FEB|nr:FAD-dependent monooxygenase [Kitasatospora sp. GAS204B]MDH6120727.1 2-polyprenyl-6-methoxyphenol hydroxylase-like FAD-dependent oxidoreductase [Kitasatospora sp. GAS204B]